MKLILIILSCLLVVAIADDNPAAETTLAEEVTSEVQTSEAETKAPDAETTAAESETAAPEAETSADTSASEAETTLETSPAPSADPETSSSEASVSIVETTAAPALSCDSWPTQLKSLRECCEVPDHTNQLAQSICTARCSTNHRDTQLGCILKCYVARTHLIKNGVVDKRIAKKLLETNAYDRRWKQIIEVGVRKCEYNVTGSLNEDLAKYFSCVGDYLADNCINFVESTECDAVQEHFENCHNITANCSAWPIGLLQPDGCCLTPTLTVDGPRAKCKTECQQKEMFVYRQAECELNCTTNATGMTTADGLIDYAAVKKVLLENATKTLDWEKPIEYAVQTCEKMMAGGFCNVSIVAILTLCYRLQQSSPESHEIHVPRTVPCHVSQRKVR